MPDWFYRTTSRPLLFRLPAAVARDFALGFMGTLARLPLGPSVIDFLGHMGPDRRLRRSVLNITFPTAVGLGPWLDVRATALPALARFGVGFLEVGPVTLTPSSPVGPVRRLPEQEALWYPEPPGLGLNVLRPRLVEASRLGLPLMVRLGHTPGTTASQSADECRRLLAELAAHAHLFSLATLAAAIADGWSVEQWTAHLRPILDAAWNASPPRPVVLCIPADLDPAKADPLISAALTAGVGGLLVDSCIRGEPDGILVGLPARGAALEQVRYLRHRYGKEVPIIAAGGVHEPEDALALLTAGADLLQVDTGLVYTGPGLPKRINEALLFAATQAEATPAEVSPRPMEMTWFWTALMGLGMFLGSLLALAIAATRVVLPYDESFVGMSRAQLEEINPRLLSFMAHDRVSLAGTMVAIGVLYLGLSLYGVRRGLHWAQQTVFISAFTGFATFFLFLGFGYLDPFHAFVTAALLQLLLLGLHCKPAPHMPTTPPELRGDWRWRWALWGQFLLILHGGALLVAGLTISAIGATSVFVPEDLAFMKTTAEALRSADPRLVPLIAHDRATFGGMLLSSGWAFLLPALWGFRAGSRWLWWTLLSAGVSAYAAAIGIHYGVGYIDFHHLLPAFAGLGLFLVGLGLAYPYLAGGAAASWTGEKRRGQAST